MRENNNTPVHVRDVLSVLAAEAPIHVYTLVRNPNADVDDDGHTWRYTSKADVPEYVQGLEVARPGFLNLDGHVHILIDAYEEYPLPEEYALPDETE